MASGLKLVTHQNVFLLKWKSVKIVTSANHHGRHHKRGLIHRLRIPANYLVVKYMRYLKANEGLKANPHTKLPQVLKKVSVEWLVQND